MNRGIHSPPRLLALLACAAAVIAAIGAFSPRLRASGRDRVVRAGIARASALRTDGSRGWVAPTADHDADVSEARLALQGDAPPGLDDRPAPSWAPRVAVSPAAPPAHPLPLPARPVLRVTRGLLRLAAGRAPPLA